MTEDARKEIRKLADNISSINLAYQDSLQPYDRFILNSAVEALGRLSGGILRGDVTVMPGHELLAVSRQERTRLIDGLMILIRTMEEIPENDKSELTELESLLHRLMGWDVKRVREEQGENDG